MYSRAIPMPNDEKDEDTPTFDPTKDMNDPNNFEDFDNEEIVRA